MTKWECIRSISELGSACRKDTILQLLDWCGKPNTASVTEEEARAYLALLRGESAAPERA